MIAVTGTEVRSGAALTPYYFELYSSANTLVPTFSALECPPIASHAMAVNDTPGGPAYLYDAFISYRHIPRDRKWAEWLIAALESYRLPKALQERGLPPRLGKIFRDEDEVAASPDLNEHIKEALAASRFLIVVCSAFTPRSKWVAREIEIFNELGRSDQVLALLTEGEP